MKQINRQIVKQRSRALTLLFDSYTTNDGLVGQVVDVWVDTEIARDGERTVGHTKQYTKVLIPMDHSLIGKRVSVKILSAAKFHVVGEVVKGDEAHKSTPQAHKSTPQGQQQQQQQVEGEQPIKVEEVDAYVVPRSSSSSTEGNRWLSWWMLYVLPVVVALLAALVFLLLQ
jgi:hypothetical protein